LHGKFAEELSQDQESGLPEAISDTDTANLSVEDQSFTRS